MVEKELSFSLDKGYAATDWEARPLKRKQLVEQYEQVAIHEGAVAAHLDFSFHLAVARATHNLRIVEAVQSVEYDISHGVNLFRYMVRYDHLARSRQVFDEHTRILQAIECRDAAEARAAMSYHLDQARVRMAIRRPELATASK